MGESDRDPEEVEKELVHSFFGKKREGFFVEVGANDPRRGSQTWLLEQNGWRGILVEPQSALYRTLVAERKNSKVYNVACGAPDQRGTAMLHLATETGFATLEKQVDSLGIEFVGTEAVKIVPLDELVAQEGNPRIDFLSIDVEGGEVNVLRGFDLQRHRPALILIEDGVRTLEKHHYMTSRGYKLVKRTTLNNWYVPRETRFTMTTFGERMELFRKMFLATPFRQWRLAARQRREKRRAKAEAKV